MSEARDELLGRVISYYGQHGVRDTSLRTLAASIGTSQRMLHYHFGSREELLVAVIRTVVDADTALVSDLFAKHTDPYEAGREHWKVVSENARVFGALFFELSTHAMYGLDHAELLTATLVRNSEEAFESAFFSLTDRLTARDLSRLTVAVGRGLLFQALVDDDFDASDRAIERFIRMVATDLGAEHG